VDDTRIGRIARALRRRKGWRQVDVAARVPCNQTTISRLERGHLSTLSIRLIRRVFLVLEAGFDGNVRWRAGDVERLLDESHAAIVEATAAFLRGHGWLVIEESYSEYGERGSIDILAVSESHLAAAVVEVKGDLASVEATIRKHGEKVRLAPTIVARRWGWRPRHVGRILVVGEDRTARRVVERHEATFRSTYPGASRAVRDWLTAPTGNIAGIWFLSPRTGRAGSQRAGGSRRVRKAT
jgi:transcriptional regulator with XRE-family HTH domain